jgi:hypothetical protein
VDPVGEVEQRRVTGPVVQPEENVDRVAPPGGAPAVGEHGVRLTRHELEEPGEHTVDARVAVMVGPRPERVQHRHVRPQVGVTVEAGAQPGRTEEPVGRLGGEHSFDPPFGVGQHPWVTGHVAEVAVSAQPVRHLLPAVELGVHPTGPAEVQEVGDLLEPAVQSVDLTVELGGEPAAGADGPGW